MSAPDICSNAGHYKIQPNAVFKMKEILQEILMLTLEDIFKRLTFLLINHDYDYVIARKFKEQIKKNQKSGIFNTPKIVKSD